MLPADSFEADVGEGTASLQVTDLDVDDYFSIGNALFGPPGNEVSGNASYAITWGSSPSSRRVDVRNTTDRFVGSYLVNENAAITWEASNQTGFRFASSPDGAQVVSAQLGHERNGVFFR
jgi:hypothetical protein